MIIDNHFHVAGVSNKYGCYISNAFKKRHLKFIIPKSKWYKKPLSIFNKLTDEIIKEIVDEILEKSKCVDGIVLLAMDQVYDSNGAPDISRTHLYVSNKFIKDFYDIVKKKDFDKTDKKKKKFFGASVNPNRKDWEEELERVAEQGAVLIKWIPSAQDIDPADNKHEAFYKKMIELKLPLLCHTGVEHTIPCAGVALKDKVEEKKRVDKLQALNHPELLKTALDAGVTVIAAHCGIPLEVKDIGYSIYETSYPVLREMMNSRKYENLYADISAFVVNEDMRLEYVKKVLKELPHEKLMFGTDLPCLPMTLSSIKNGKFGFWKSLDAFFTLNLLDRHYKALKYFGFEDCVFENTEKVLLKG